MDSSLSTKAHKTYLVKSVPGGHTGGAPPVPIPNTEVKPSKADVTAAARQWESRTLPGYNEGPLVERSAGLFLFCVTRSSVQKKVGGFYPRAASTTRLSACGERLI